MLRFMLILDTSSEERHSKDNVEPKGISMMKCLDIVSISLRLAASVYVVYWICLLSLKIGVSSIKPCLFVSAEI